MTWYEVLCLAGIPTIITTIIFWIFNTINEKRKRNSRDNVLLKEGVQALLRDSLMKDYRYFKGQGWIDIADKQNFDNMYQKYHSLGKNGVMDSMYGEIMALPTFPPAKAVKA